MASGFGEALSERRAGFDYLPPDPAEALVREHAETDGAEVVGVPALLVGEVGPLAGDGAGGAGEAPGGLPGKEVGQVEELPRGVEYRRTVLAEP